MHHQHKHNGTFRCKCTVGVFLLSRLMYARPVNSDLLKGVLVNGDSSRRLSIKQGRTHAHENADPICESSNINLWSIMLASSS